MNIPASAQTLLAKGELPQKALALLRQAAEAAQGQGVALYLVGGVVRDLALGQPVADLDLVAEGDALKLAEGLASTLGGHLRAPSQFGTIKLKWENLLVDIVTARSETYSRPGALPKVRPGSIYQDLFRRDFTANAMAIRLDGPSWGQLLDPHKGMEDLSKGLIRIIHERSFIDDPTRIFRALRYEQRLGFRLETKTETLLKNNLEYLNALSGERLWKDLEKVFTEREPERPLNRAQELGVMTAIHPALEWNASWLKEKFQAARSAPFPAPPPQPILYFCLLVYGLDPRIREELAHRLKLAGSRAKALQDLTSLKAALSAPGGLAEPNIPPSQVYGILAPFSPVAVLAAALAHEGSQLWSFYNDLRHVRPILRGHHLIALGVPSGPKMGQILQALKEARMDGLVRTQRDEKKLVAKWLSGT